MSSKPFSYRRALDNDFNLTLAIIVPLAIWAVFLLARMLGASGRAILIIAVTATVIGPLLTWRRLRWLRAFFERGEEVPGKLQKVYFYQDRGRLDYTYTYLEKKYMGSAAIHKTAITRAFSVGQVVTLVINRDNPEHALLLELYT